MPCEVLHWMKSSRLCPLENHAKASKQMARIEVGIVVFLFALFVALQPGVFLTLPNNSLA